MKDRIPEPPVPSGAAEEKATLRSHGILFLNTLAFTVCFAAWMINGVLVTFLVNNGVFKWSSVEIGWLLGLPVLVGSVFRLPAGILTDRFGGKWVMAAILFASAVPMFLLSRAGSYPVFLALSFGFGLTGASFAAGVAYTALWYPKSRQGTALGVFGAGNMGAALTTMLAPKALNMLTADRTNLEGRRTLPVIYAGVLVAVGVVFLVFAENRTPGVVKNMGQRLAPLKEARVWRFGLYYFATFGGFVALSQWLVPYFVNVYTMTIVAAGLMTTAFNLPSGLIRIVGGMLSDRVGARRVLYWVFGSSLACLVLLMPPRVEIRTPGQGVMATGDGIVASVGAEGIVIRPEAEGGAVTEFPLIRRESEGGKVDIRFGMHTSEEGFLFLPTAFTWHEAVVKEGDVVKKGHLLAKGMTQLYFQANRWIFTILVFLLGVMFGMGSAAVYKHISSYYPSDVGSVGGIVGVLGGLGGFFFPIAFGYLLKLTGIWTACWMFIALTVLASLVLMHFAISRTKVGVYKVPTEALTGKGDPVL